MKIKYKFITDEEVELEVSDELGCYIEASRRKESTGKRKYHRYNISLDAVVYEGAEFGGWDTYFPEEEKKAEQKRIEKMFAVLTEVQRRRVKKLAQGWTYDKIAKSEGVSFQSVSESLEAARKKIKKFLERP